MAVTLLKSEWLKISQDQPPLCYAEPNDNDVFHWKALMMGPPGSPFQGTSLFLDIVLPTNYPFRPPKINFVNPLFHPNVSNTGYICMDVLSSEWSPAIGIARLLISITSILSKPLLDMDETPFKKDAANMYENDRENYNKVAGDSCQNRFTIPQYQHLYFKFYFRQFGNLRKKLLTFNYGNEVLIEDLCYPNDKLDKNFVIFEKETCKFIPSHVIKVHEKAKLIYEEVKEAKNDIGRLMSAMVKSGDVEFVENNMEFMICENVHNIVLWKLYFMFLRENNAKKLLQMYSLYCRFFPSDEDTFEDYKQAVEKFGPSLILWKNPYDFEVFDENVLYARFGVPLKDKQPITCYFTERNAILQNLPFKSPLMNYILQTSAPQILQKLHKSCKYLFIQIRTPVCYKLEITNEIKYPCPLIEFEENSAKIYHEFPPKFQNIRVSTVLTVKETVDTGILSKCLPKIHRCDAKYITISHQNLTTAEMKFLICTKNLVELYLKKCKFVDVDGNGIMLEEILKNTPKIRKLNTDCVIYGSQTSEILAQLSFINKIELFRVASDVYLEPYGFAEFVKKNAASKGGIVLQFLPNINEK